MTTSSSRFGNIFFLDNDQYQEKLYIPRAVNSIWKEWKDYAQWNKLYLDRILFVCYREKYSQAIYAVNNNQIDYILIPCTFKWSLTFLQTAYCSVTNATFTAQKSTRESFLGSIINTLCNQQILNYLYTYF